MVTFPSAPIARNPSTSSTETVFAAAICCAPTGATPPANPNVTTSAPLTKSRRVPAAPILSSIACASTLRIARRALHRADHAQMGAAATKIVGERPLDFGHAGILVVGEQRDRANDHTIETVAALCRLLVDEGLLHR